MVLTEKDIEDFVDAIREQSSSHQVAFTLFVNCQGFTMKAEDRTPDDLKRNGISMRNLKGEWIKQ